MPSDMTSGKTVVTLGDPAGIGPEVVAKTLFTRPDLRDKTVIVGSKLNFIRSMEAIDLGTDFVDGLDFFDIPGRNVQPGMSQEEAGRIALDSIQTAVDLITEGKGDSLCTAPINKKSIIAAGSKDIDHTTMLSRFTGTDRVSTLFEVGKLRILFANKHVPLAEAVASITIRNVQNAIDLAAEALTLLDIGRKKIAVAALNPHAGESGLIGREEIDEITPAIYSRKNLYDVSGPYPADSVFHRAASGEFNIVVSLYHDQGHIAAKMLDFNGTVSMNLGLPFLRTSVDHGTAFDIAGKGIANPESMIRSIDTALKYASGYRKNFLRLHST